MAFSSVSRGAECGPSNPMAGLMKQFQQDRSLQQDRMMGNQRGESSKSGFRTRPAQGSVADRQFADEFMQEDRAVERPAGIFEFNGLNRELDVINASPQHALTNDWANDFMQQPLMQHHPSGGFEEFEKIYQQNQPDHKWHSEFAAFQQSHPNEIAITDHERQAFETAFEEAKQGNVNWEQEFAAQDSWATEFAEQDPITQAEDKEALARTAAMLLDSVRTEENPKFKNSNFMNLMRKLKDREVAIEGNKMVETRGEDWAADFAQTHTTTDPRQWQNEFTQNMGQSSSGKMWSSEFNQKPEHSWTSEFDQMDGESMKETNASSDAIDWAAEFTKHGPMDPAVLQKVLKDGTDTSDWIRQYQENIAHLRTAKDDEWDSMQKDWDTVTGEKQGYRAANPEYDNYTFALNNPYLLNPAAINEDHVSLGDTILALEAKAQLVTSDSNAWQELGLRQQENERDAAAIAALKRAVSMNPSLLEAWLALAVSYTNESCREDAYECLEQWIVNNNKYKHLAQRGGMPKTVEGRHEYVTNIFLEAARSFPGEEMDANVQVGLGVLFNVSEEYEKAIDCFRAAVQSRPQDYLLWNKLGATLANSRNTSGSIEAYFNALEINPSYVRARYNLAISCINLGQHREAAEHLLTSLALQQAGDASTSAAVMSQQKGGIGGSSGAMSENVWDSLRMVMYMMNREDLASQCDRRNLDAFRGVFEF
ncbi:hypothetical protein CLU79DRAFT_756987 [Phycomyces nitens]|nr:hypothetical protein CLU79DRAFT_756987 [Phycomyces nitens]